MNLNRILIIISIILFISIVAILQIIQIDYNPIYQFMSELALGEYGLLMFYAFLAFAIALFVLQKSLSIYKNSQPIRILLVISSIALTGAGLFKLGIYTNLHILFIFITFFSIALSMYLMPRLIEPFQKFFPAAVSWGLLFCLAVFIVLGQFAIPIGISQRLATGCILLWLLYFSQMQ
jgi:hypothetical protein